MTYDDFIEFLDNNDACYEARDWLWDYHEAHPSDTVAAIFDALPQVTWRVWLHVVLHVPFTQVQADLALKVFDAFELRTGGNVVDRAVRGLLTNSYRKEWWEDVVDYAAFVLEQAGDPMCDELVELNNALRADCPSERLVALIKEQQ